MRKTILVLLALVIITISGCKDSGLSDVEKLQGAIDKMVERDSGTYIIEVSDPLTERSHGTFKVEFFQDAVKIEDDQGVIYFAYLYEEDLFELVEYDGVFYPRFVEPGTSPFQLIEVWTFPVLDGFQLNKNGYYTFEESHEPFYSLKYKVKDEYIESVDFNLEYNDSVVHINIEYSKNNSTEFDFPKYGETLYQESIIELIYSGFTYYETETGLEFRRLSTKTQVYPPNPDFDTIISYSFNDDFYTIDYVFFLTLEFYPETSIVVYQEEQYSYSSYLVFDQNSEITSEEFELLISLYNTLE